MADLFELLISEMTDRVRLRYFNPSRDWPPRRISELSFDLARCSLNDVTLDRALAEAAVFGPADKVMGDRASPDLLYLALGLEVDCHEESIVHFHLVMSTAHRSGRWRAGLNPAIVSVIQSDGTAHPFSASTSETRVIEALGQSIETGPIGKARVHSFIVGKNFIDTYHDPDSGSLLEMTFGLATEESA